MKEFDFKQITPGLKKEYYTNQEIEKTSKDVLMESGRSINEENITPIDLFSIPEGLSQEEKIQIISKNLRMEGEDLAKNLPKISRYWRESRDFLKNFLLFGSGENHQLPSKEIEELNNFKNVEELIKTLDKATVIKKKDKLVYSPLYCALANLMIAHSEFEGRKLQGLKNESQYMVNKFFEKGPDGVAPFNLTGKEEDEDWSRVGILLSEDSYEGARFSFRGKTKNSTIMKLAKDPASSTESMIRDGIGLRFEVSNTDKIKKIFDFICRFTIDRFKAYDLVLENVNLLNETEQEEFSSQLKQYEVRYEKQENPSSSPDYKCVKIRGKIRIPENGKEGNLILPRDFEVQMVPTDNKNETGLNQNKIYKRVQKLSLFTRLFGSFSEEYLNRICQEASEASGISTSRIKDHIIRHYLAKLVPSPESTKIKYVSYDQFQRWEKAGIIPSGININKKDVKRLEELGKNKETGIEPD
jgi:hypothetical protein